MHHACGVSLCVCRLEAKGRKERPSDLTSTNQCVYNPIPFAGFELHASTGGENKVSMKPGHEGICELLVRRSSVKESWLAGLETVWMAENKGEIRHHHQPFETEVYLELC